MKKLILAVSVGLFSQVALALFVKSLREVTSGGKTLRTRLPVFRNLLTG
jgi:hypothetical protein